MKESKSIKLTDVRKEIEKECLFYNDFSKKMIVKLTRLYLTHLRKDGYEVRSWIYNGEETSPFSHGNIVRIQKNLKKYGTLNNANGR
jgi:hypothetical protein